MRNTHVLPQTTPRTLDPRRVASTRHRRRQPHQPTRRRIRRHPTGHLVASLRQPARPTPNHPRMRHRTPAVLPPPNCHQSTDGELPEPRVQPRRRAKPEPTPPGSPTPKETPTKPPSTPSTRRVSPQAAPPNPPATAPATPSPEHKWPASSTAPTNKQGCSRPPPTRGNGKGSRGVCLLRRPESVSSSQSLRQRPTRPYPTCLTVHALTAGAVSLDGELGCP